MAKKAGVSQAAISKRESSKKVSDKNFEKFSRAANCSWEEFEKVKKALPPE